MIRGSCLCGGVRFEIARAVGPFELCHCSRCRKAICTRCGSPVPHPPPGATWFEVPAGLLDADPGVRPDKHIFVEHKSPWFEITDALPRLTKAELHHARRPTGGG